MNMNLTSCSKHFFRLTLTCRIALCLIVIAIPGAHHATAQEKVSLFNGKNFDGWEGDLKNTWRIEEGAIVAGSLTEKVPRNEFLCTKSEYQEFELRLKYKLEGTEGFVNGGVQIRSSRIPNHHEMIGYQADIGGGFDGALYDESRRNKVLSGPEKSLAEKIAKRDDWNDYRIRCEGKRIQLWLNGTQTVDFTEADDSIAQRGVIGLQIHGDGKSIIRFKELTLEPLHGLKDESKP